MGNIYFGESFDTMCESEVGRLIKDWNEVKEISRITRNAKYLKYCKYYLVKIL